MTTKEDKLAYLQNTKQLMSESILERKQELASLLGTLNSFNADNDPDGIERFNLGCQGLRLTKEINADSEILRQVEALLAREQL